MCLIKWDEPITYSSRIQPICITEKKVNEFSPGFISAWAEEDQFMLHEAEMFVMDFNNCNKAKGSIFSIIILYEYQILFYNFKTILKIRRNF